MHTHSDHSVGTLPDLLANHIVSQRMLVAKNNFLLLLCVRPALFLDFWFGCGLLCLVLGMLVLLLGSDVSPTDHCVGPCFLKLLGLLLLLFLMLLGLIIDSGILSLLELGLLGGVGKCQSLDLFSACFALGEFLRVLKVCLLSGAH